MTSVVQPPAAGLTNMTFAGRVARQVEMESIRIRRARLEILIANPEQIPATLRFDTNANQSYRISEDRQLLTVTLEYRLDLVDPEQGTKGIAVIEAEYELRYSGKVALEGSDADFRWFAELNGVFNSWPYWRELVQTSLGRAGIGHPVLPVFRVSSVPVDESGTQISQSAD